MNRPPAKTRHRERPNSIGYQSTEQGNDDGPPMSYSALGGHYDDSGYTSGRGQFGFTHDVTPPSHGWGDE